jgi:hypothetical protein
LGGGQEDDEVLLDLRLSNKLTQALGPQRILIAVVITGLRGDHPFAHKSSIPVRFDKFVLLFPGLCDVQPFLLPTAPALPQKKIVRRTSMSAKPSAMV